MTLALISADYQSRKSDMQERDRIREQAVGGLEQIRRGGKDRGTGTEGPERLPVSVVMDPWDSTSPWFWY